MKAKREVPPDKPHFLGHRQRLQERFKHTGSKGLADYELLELLLTYAIPRRDVKPIAKMLLHHFGNLKGVLDASFKDLLPIKGIGPQTAIYFLTLRTYMKRYFELTAQESDLLNSPQTVIQYCRSSLESEKNEVFEILYLSTKNRLIRAERLSEGTIDRTAVYPRQVIEGALSAKAAALIIVHNHPSGDPTPSQEDILMTQKLSKAAQAVDITVHDHIIIGNGRHVSFREKGLLPENP